MAPEAVTATTRPAWSCWKWPPKSISTSIMPTSATICTKEKGRRYRQLSGLDAHIPSESDLSHFRYRVGAEAIDQTMAAVVELVFRTVGVITGELLSTDGQLEPFLFAL